MSKDYIYPIYTSKFKDIDLSIRLLEEISEENATQRSILTLMLADRCVSYPTKKMMSEKLDNLYGASFNFASISYGKSHVIELSSKIIHPSYTDDANLFEDYLLFLKEILYHPLWDEQGISEAKKLLKAKIKRNDDEPSQFAISQALKRAGKDYPLGISALGNIEDIDKCTLADIKKCYERMLATNQLMIFIGGDLDKKWIEQIRNHFPNCTNNTNLKCNYKIDNIAYMGKVETYRDISQSNIVMIYGSDVELNDDDYFALKVANALLGQYSTSLLFQEVREKNSLCYSIYSSLIAFDGAIGIVTGVDEVNIDKTIELIQQEIAVIKDGKFLDSLLAVVKGMIENTLIAADDNMKSLIAQKFQNVILNTNLSTKEAVEKIHSINKDDVKKVMQKCYPILTYVLTKGNEQNASN